MSFDHERRPRRALVVDEYEGVRMLLRRMLSEVEIDTVLAGCADEAIVFLRSHAHEVDVLVTEVGGVGSSSERLISHVLEHHGGLPIVCLSPYMHADRDAHGAPRPRVSLLPKPFTAAQLAESIARAVVA